MLFVGIKLVLTPWYHIPISISLGIIIVILVLAIVFSVWKAKQVEGTKPNSDAAP